MKIEGQWFAVPENKYGITGARIRWDTDSNNYAPGWVLDTRGERLETDGASPDTWDFEHNERGALAALNGSLWYHYGIKIEVPHD